MKLMINYEVREGLVDGCNDSESSKVHTGRQSERCEHFRLTNTSVLLCSIYIAVETPNCSAVPSTSHIVMLKN